jgi:DNA repair protein RecO (recombination protein O)
MQALRYLRHFQRSSYLDAQRARLKPAIDSEIERIMQHYLTHVLEKGLKTPTFLKRMIRERSNSQED